MLADNASGARAADFRGKHIFVGFDREDLSTHHSGHTCPVEQGKDHEHRKHIGAQLLEQRELIYAQHLLQHNREQHHHQHIRQGVDDINNPHHDEVDLAAQISGNASVYHADDQNQKCGKNTYDQ